VVVLERISVSPSVDVMFNLLLSVLVAVAGTRLVGMPSTGLAVLLP
jgi:hypothetical protein